MKCAWLVLLTNLYRYSKVVACGGMAMELKRLPQASLIKEVELAFAGIHLMKVYVQLSY